MRRTTLMLAALLAVLAAVPARAACKDDVKDLKVKIQQNPTNDVATARKELAKAEKAQNISETDCNNAVARAWRALRTPPKLACPAPPGAPAAQVEQCLNLQRRGR